MEDILTIIEETLKKLNLIGRFMAQAYVHNLDPFLLEFSWEPLVKIFGTEFGIRWYGMAYLMGFICGYLALRYMIKRGTMPLNAEQMADYVTYVAIGTMVGGRLGYCLFYAPETLWDFHGAFPYWGLLEVNKGGMASHGGIIGIIVAAFLFGRKYKINKLFLVDMSSLMGGLGIFFGRIANFINGELYGRECPPDYSWPVKFPSELHNWAVYHTEKLKELAPQMDTIAAQLKLQHLTHLKFQILETLSPETWTSWVNQYSYSGQARYNISSTIDEIILAIQNGSVEMANALAPVLTSRYPSQLYQALMEGLFVLVVCNIVWLKPRKPGVITAIFGLLYALMRIAGEQYRMPDAHLGFQALGLTRGQWLSVGMVAVALVFMWIALKGKGQPMGGWNVLKKKTNP